MIFGQPARLVVTILSGIFMMANYYAGFSDLFSIWCGPVILTLQWLAILSTCVLKIANPNYSECEKTVFVHVMILMLAWVIVEWWYAITVRDTSMSNIIYDVLLVLNFVLLMGIVDGEQACLYKPSSGVRKVDLIRRKDLDG